MNGLQSLDQWENAFHHPSSSMLGLLNAIQVWWLFVVLNTTIVNNIIPEYWLSICLPIRSISLWWYRTATDDILGRIHYDCCGCHSNRVTDGEHVHWSSVGSIVQFPRSNVTNRWFKLFNWLWSYLRCKRCSNACLRNLVPTLSCPFDFTIQFTMVFWRHHVRLYSI